MKKIFIFYLIFFITLTAFSAIIDRIYKNDQIDSKNHKETKKHAEKEHLLVAVVDAIPQNNEQSISISPSPTNEKRYKSFSQPHTFRIANDKFDYIIYYYFDDVGNEQSVKIDAPLIPSFM